MTGLVTGKAYSFYVEAISYNGVGQPSDETFAYACIAPWGMQQAQYVSSTKSQITIAWRPPILDGGCPIYTYALFVNGILTDDNVINKRPYLQLHTITGLTQVGQQYSIKIRAYNDIDWIESDPLGVILAAVPDAPATVPYQDYSQTSSTQIKVLYDEFLTTMNGGSAVLGYDLWRDDGMNGNFFRLYTVDNVL